MKVKNIKVLEYTEDVYCMEVEDTHCFALENGVVAHNCCGHDLARLLAEGFNGVAGRVGSRPPKHLREALYQMANYIGILQAEWGGAQAFSSFDTYLAPYVFIDQTLNELSYDDIKKAIRNFVYNVNVPSRWGQCVPENYKCLKADGTWVTYTDLNIGDEIYVIDMNTGSLKCDKITHINVFDSPDEMHHYSNKQGFNFKVTPNHRIIYKTGSNPFRIKESSELLNISQISVPVAPWNKKEPIVNEIDKDYDISDDVLAFITFIMTDGCIVKQEGKSPYISFCKSEKRWGGEFFEMLCNKLSFTYTKREKKSFGVAESVTVEYRLHVNDEILNIINMFNSQDKHKVPSFFKYLSSRQCKLVLDYWVKLDGNTDGGHWKMQADNNEIQEMLAYLAIRSGQSTSLNERIIGTNKNATKYTMVHKRGNRMCTPEIVKADTKKVWCPTTNTGTFVCMTNEGYVFLTGNCPFSNVTIDYTVPRDLANQYPKYEEGYLFEAVYNGYADKDSEDIKNFIKAIEDKLGTELCTEIKEDTNSVEEYHKELLQSLGYKHFEPEMRLIVKAFYETLNEGDEAGRPFTFPIPTVNITEDFNWDDENANLIFENAGKYGSSYFQNFIGSQYKRNPETGKLESDPNAYRPSDVRSMCPLTLDTQVVTKRGNDEDEQYIKLGELNPDTDMVKGSDGNWYHFIKTEIYNNKKIVKFTVIGDWMDANIEREVKMSVDHLQPVCSPDNLDTYITKVAEELQVGDILPCGGYKGQICEIIKKEYVETEPTQCISMINSKDNLFVLANCILTHNCRLQLDKRELRKKGGGLFGADAQTGSIGVVTINMARLGYLCKGDKKLLIKKLTHLMELAKNTLEKKRVFVKEMLNRGLYPYTKRYLRTFDTFFSTIGVNGMNEMIRNFTNDEHDITDEYGQKFALEILTFIREKLKEYQELTDNLFNLEATPAEGCLSGDSWIWTESGNKKISDLIGQQNIKVFSFNESTKEIELSDVESIFMTTEKAQVMKITFDNGREIISTLNHPFAKRVCEFGKGEHIEWINATNLKIGDRIKSVYLTEKDSGHVLAYNQKVHQIVGKYKFGIVPEGYVIHHINENKWDNSLNNLTMMTDADHRRLHLKNQQAKGHNLVGYGENNSFYGKKHSVKSKLQNSKAKAQYTEDEAILMEDAYVNGELSCAQISRMLNDKIHRARVARFIRTRQNMGLITKNNPTCQCAQFNKVNVEYLKNKGFSKNEVVDILGGSFATKAQIFDYYDFISTPNHKIVGIEYLTKEIPVYNMTVKDNHNYYVSDSEDAKDYVLTHNCTRRLAALDTEKYPDIITAGKEGMQPYYTNSSQLPVGYTDDVFQALDLQDDLQTSYTGGTVLHLYMSEPITNVNTVKQLVKSVLTNYRLPYISVTPSYSSCPVHGYIPGHHKYCPKCDTELVEKYSNCECNK